MNILGELRTKLTNPQYERDRLLEQRNNAPSTTGDMFKQSLNDDSLVGIAIEESGQFYRDFTIDRDETFINNNLKTLIDRDKGSIHKDFVDDLESRAKNLEHYNKLKAEYQDLSKRETDLENSGLLGIGLRFASEITNIPAYMYLPEVLGARVAIAMNSTLARRGVYGAVEGVLFEYIKDKVGDTEKSNLELGIGAGIGLVVGAKFGNLSSSVLSIAQNNTKAQAKITPKVEQELISATSKKQQNEILDKHFKKHDIGKRSDYEKELMWLQKRAEDGTFNKGVASKLRADLKHLTGKSDSEIMQSLGKQNFKDSSLQGNATGIRTNNEEAMAIEDTLIEKSQMLFNPLINEFASKVYGQNWLSARWGDARVVISNIAGNMQMKRNLFNSSEEIIPEAEILRSGKEALMKYGAKEDVAKELVKKISKASKELYPHSREILQRYGKKGFEKDGIKENVNFMPIVYTRDMKQALDKIGLSKANLKDFLKGSLLSNITKRTKEALTDDDEQMLDVMSKLLTDAIYHTKSISSESGNSFDDIMRGILKERRDELININPKLAKILFNESAEMTKRTGTSSRFRSPFDYSYTQKFKDKNLNDAELSFMDLVNKNLLGNHIQYARKMGGAVALEKTKFKFVKEKFDFDKMKSVKEDITRYIKEENSIKQMLKTIDDGDLDGLVRVVTENISDQKILKEVADIVNKIKLKALKPKETQVAIDRFNKIIGDVESSLTKKLDEVYKAIESGVPEELVAIGDDIIDSIRKSEEFFRGLRAEAFNITHDKKDKEMIDDIFGELMLKNKSTVDDMNKKLNDLFTKKIEEEYSLGTAGEREVVRKKMIDQLNEKGVSERDAHAEIVRFDEIVDDYLGKPTATDPFSALTQAQRIAANLNIARLLGQTGITMSAELGGLVFRTGILGILEFSSLKSLMKQMKTGNIDDKLAQEIQTHIGLGTALTREINPAYRDHEFDLSELEQIGVVDGILNKLENFSTKASDAVLMLGGVKPLTANGEIVIAKTVINEISMIAGKGKKALSSLDIKNLNEMGIDEAMAKRIHNQILEHGSFTKKTWSNGHKVQELGYDKWVDDEAKMQLVNSARRISNNIIQKSMLGDKVGTVYGDKLLKNSLFGRIFLELKDYMITSYVAQLGRMLTRRDAHMLGSFMAQASALSVATIGQNYMNYAGNEEKLKKSLEPKKLVEDIFTKMPASSYIPTAVDVASNTLTGERIFSPSRHQTDAQNILMSMPTIDMLVKLQSVISETTKSIYETEVSDGLIRNLFGLAPAGNLPVVKTVKESLLSE